MNRRINYIHFQLFEQEILYTVVQKLNNHKKLFPTNFLYECLLREFERYFEYLFHKIKKVRQCFLSFQFFK